MTGPESSSPIKTFKYFILLFEAYRHRNNETGPLGFKAVMQLVLSVCEAAVHCSSYDAELLIVSLGMDL